MIPARKNMLLTTAFVLLAIYSVSLLALYLSQRSFMYHPSRGSEQHFLELAATRGVQPWRDARGELLGWKRVGQGTANKRMLILHGNGGDALSRTYLMDGFEKLGGWDFYSLEYPGYAWREGAPSEASILDDAEKALLQLQQDSRTPIFATGESLGTGVACLLAARQPQALEGLFLVTPYTSTADIAAGRFPFFPVRFLMQDRYDATVALRDYSGPVAILLAGSDYIVPTRYGQALFDGYEGPKQLWIQQQAGHNTLDFDPTAPWWNEVEQFLLQRPDGNSPQR